MFAAVIQGADIKDISAFPIQQVASLSTLPSEYKKIIDFLRDIPTVLSEYTCIS